MQKSLYSLSLLLCFAVVGKAQPLQLPHQPAGLSDTTELKVKLRGSSYFYNYEYFKPFAKGFTQPGFSLVPTVEANLGSKLVLGGGVHLKKYWGDAPFGKVTPVVFARYEACKNFFVQVGTLENRDGHLLSTILYNPLHGIDFRQENGLQLRYYGKRMFVDTWVSWENYIREGDNDQERLTAGFSFLGKLTSDENPWEVSIPVQSVFKHIGGQINDKEDTLKKVRTLANLGAGLQVAYRFDEGKRLGALVQVVKFNDNYNFKPFKGNSGNKAISATLFMKSKSLDMQLGYLYGKRFFTILGDPIYNDVTFDYNVIDYTRSLISATGSYSATPFAGVQFRFDAGAYYDPSYTDLDYYYGAGFIFDLNVFGRRFSR